MNNIRDNGGKFVKNAVLVDKTCENCGKGFKIKTSSLKYGRGKCCSRKCVDENKKKTYLGKNNGMFGKKASKERRQKHSEDAKQLWRVHRKKILNGMEKYVKDHGHNPGQSENAKKKRKETLLKKYGVDHPWKVKSIRKKCDETCYKLYGKYSWDLFLEASLYGHDTKIERRIQNILSKNNIKFQIRKQLPFGDSYKEYDIFIPKLKLLIEADGDFWHANPIMFPTNSPLYPVQQANIENDKIKNILAKKYGFNLIRYWESVIKLDNFEKILLDEILKYENKN